MINIWVRRDFGKTGAGNERPLPRSDRDGIRKSAEILKIRYLEQLYRQHGGDGGGGCGDV